STRIEKVLNKQDGVKLATVNLTTESASIEYNPGLIDVKSLIDIRLVWDRDEKTFQTIHDDDLLSQDGESVLLNYDDQYNNNKIVIQPTEEYIKGTDQIETIKVPRSAIKKRSSIDGIYHFG